MAKLIQDNLYRVSLDLGQQCVFISAKDREELLDFLAHNFSGHKIEHVCQLEQDGSEPPIPVVADLLGRQAKEDKPHIRDELSDVRRLCNKPFMSRTGAEQEYLVDYWFNRSADFGQPASSFLGMTSKEFTAWLNGDLKLADGSYHELEPSEYHLSDNALETARDILANKRTLNTELATYVQYPRDIVRELEDQLPLMERYNLTLQSKNNALILLHGGEFMSAITQDEVLYKEDFVPLMKAAGLDATELNFKKVWAHFTPAPGFTLQDCAEVAIGKSMIPEKMPSLADKIQEAGKKTSKSVSIKKEKELEPVR